MLQGISLKKRERERERKRGREREREKEKERQRDQSSDGVKVFYSTLCGYLYCFNKAAIFSRDTIKTYMRPSI